MHIACLQDMNRRLVHEQNAEYEASLEADRQRDLQRQQERERQAAEQRAQEEAEARVRCDCAFFVCDGCEYTDVPASACACMQVPDEEDHERAANLHTHDYAVRTITW